MLSTFPQNLTLQDGFETVAQIKEKLKRTEFDGAFSKKNKLLIDGSFKFVILLETECFSKRLLSLQSYQTKSVS